MIRITSLFVILSTCGIRVLIDSGNVECDCDGRMTRVVDQKTNTSPDADNVKPAVPTRVIVKNRASLEGGQLAGFQ